MQLDVKIPGIEISVLKESMNRARTGIDHVLKIMKAIQPTWRKNFKDSVPVFETMPIAVYQRHILFRSGGYNAKLIEAETGAKVISYLMPAINEFLVLSIY